MRSYCLTKPYVFIYIILCRGHDVFGLYAMRAGRFPGAACATVFATTDAGSDENRLAICRFFFFFRGKGRKLRLSDRLRFAKMSFGIPTGLSSGKIFARLSTTALTRCYVQRTRDFFFFFIPINTNRVKTAPFSITFNKTTRKRYPISYAEPII